MDREPAICREPAGPLPASDGVRGEPADGRAPAATEGPATEGPATEGPATEGPATEGRLT
jgi:hypothetical protein